MVIFKNDDFCQKIKYYKLSIFIAILDNYILNKA